MAQFPRTEAEIVALAQVMIAGLNAHTTTYPAPPVAPANLQAKLDDFLGKQHTAIAKQAEAEEAVAEKNEALEELTNAMRSDLRYAENTVNFDDNQLQTLGWGGRAARTSLQTPGQPRALQAPRQGEGWVFLDWKEPVEGGRVAAYKVQRRDLPPGAWQDVATALVSEATLVNQERGKQWEYRIVAVNRAGEGQPSNTVAVVL